MTQAVWWSVVGLLALASMWALWSGLVRDRAKGRRRCRRCWHSMEGLPRATDGGWTCPECGLRVVSERQMLRTRRRWGRV